MVSVPMITTRITEVTKENDYITTYKFECSIEARAGQFIMVWIPGVGERPMGVAETSPLTITVAHLGEFTNAMRKLKKGDPISFRGPFGNGFTEPRKDENVLLVGGGTGLVPLYLLGKKAKMKGAKVTVIFGARSKSLLFYQNRLKEIADKLIITTDDGSSGLKGTVMEGIKTVKKIDRVYTCGPEKMMAAVVRWAAEKNIPCEASLERHMKCGLGICGSCMIGKYRVCADGPVFQGEVLLNQPDFGNWKRDASGRKVPL